MPIPSMFYGIVVRMYFFDDKQHYLTDGTVFSLPGQVPAQAMSLT